MTPHAWSAGTRRATATAASGRLRQLWRGETVAETVVALWPATIAAHGHAPSEAIDIRRCRHVRSRAAAPARLAGWWSGLARPQTRVATASQPVMPAPPGPDADIHRAATVGASGSSWFQPGNTSIPHASRRSGDIHAEPAAICGDRSHLGADRLRDKLSDEMSCQTSLRRVD